MKYSMFVGKWQPFHEGHKWLIENRLKLGKNILIGIREIEKPSYSPSEIKMQVFELFPNEVNDEIKEISGTNIRAENGKRLNIRKIN